jgi:hypothetical protein
VGTVSMTLVAKLDVYGDALVAMAVTKVPTGNAAGVKAQLPAPSAVV